MYTYTLALVRGKVETQSKDVYLTFPRSMRTYTAAIGLWLSVHHLHGLVKLTWQMSDTAKVFGIFHVHRSWGDWVTVVAIATLIWSRTIGRSADVCNRELVYRGSTLRGVIGDHINAWPTSTSDCWPKGTSWLNISDAGWSGGQLIIQFNNSLGIFPLITSWSNVSGQLQYSWIKDL